MSKVIDLEKKLEERKKIIIVKEEKRINIKGFDGNIVIYLDILEKPKETDTFFKRFLKLLKHEKNFSQLSNLVKKISEEECKQIFNDIIKMIAWKGYLEENFEEVWDEIKTYIKDYSNFRYTILKGSLNNLKKPLTFISSEVFSMIS